VAGRVVEGPAKAARKALSNCRDRFSAPQPLITAPALPPPPKIQAQAQWLPSMVFKCEASKKSKGGGGSGGGGSPLPGPTDECSKVTCPRKCGRRSGCVWCKGMLTEGQCFSDVRPMGWMGLEEAGLTRRERARVSLSLPPPGAPARRAPGLRNFLRQLSAPPLPCHAPPPPPHPQDRAKMLPPVLFTCDVDKKALLLSGRKGAPGGGDAEPAVEAM
jgi:hypothetical protein